MTEIIHLHSKIEIASHPPVRHPGKVLKEDFLKPRRITVATLATQTGLRAWRISDLLRGTRAITADMAFRLAYALDTSALYWMLLQALHELAAEQQLRDMGARPDEPEVRAHFLEARIEMVIARSGCTRTCPLFCCRHAAKSGIHLHRGGEMG